MTIWAAPGIEAARRPRYWTPPEQADRAAVRPPPPRPGSRGVGLMSVMLLVLLGFIALGALALQALPANDSADNGANGPRNGGSDGAHPAPATSGPAQHPDGGATAAAPVVAPPSARPTTRAARPLTWTLATTMPPGEDTRRADVFAAIKVGTCLAETPDLVSISLVSCSRPHTDEVTLLRDLTATFATMPTNDQIQALNSELCPAAAQAWTGGADQRYTSGYVWRFGSGVPGEAVRGFACTVTLTGHSPFTGTLRRAAA